MWFLGEFSAGWAGERYQGKPLANRSFSEQTYFFSPKVLSDPTGIQLSHYGVKDGQVQVLGV